VANVDVTGDLARREARETNPTMSMPTPVPFDTPRTLTQMYREIDETEARQFVHELAEGFYHCDCPPPGVQKGSLGLVAADDSPDKTS
jgi:hypothetical protein